MRYAACLFVVLAACEPEARSPVAVDAGRAGDAVVSAPDAGQDATTVDAAPAACQTTTEDCDPTEAKTLTSCGPGRWCHVEYSTSTDPMHVRATECLCTPPVTVSCITSDYGPYPCVPGNICVGAIGVQKCLAWHACYPQRWCAQ